MCPPQMSHEALAETSVIAMRAAATRELKLNGESEKPTLQTDLERAGEKMAPALGPTPHANATIYSNTCEGAQLVDDVAGDDSVDAVAQKSYAKVQTGMEVPLRSTSGYILSENPWPKTPNTDGCLTGAGVPFPEPGDPDSNSSLTSKKSSFTGTIFY